IKAFFKILQKKDSFLLQKPIKLIVQLDQNQLQKNEKLLKAFNAFSQANCEFSFQSKPIQQKGYFFFNFNEDKIIEEYSKAYNQQYSNMNDDLNRFKKARNIEVIYLNQSVVRTQITVDVNKHLMISKIII
ncbi:hypothetical protein IMG5_074260, partial [Ichthyophthirius multifiliis]